MIRAIPLGGLAGVIGVFAAVAVLCSPSPADDGSRPRIIRPPDDRADFFEASAELQQVGRSVGAFVMNTELTDNGDGTFSINAGTLDEESGPMCDGERYADQPTAAFCTATLIAPDHLITAGHCVLDAQGDMTALDSFRIVFDYAVQQDGVNPSDLTADQVYSVVEFVDGANVEPSLEDWAVLRLDRAAAGRDAIPIRTSGTLIAGDSVYAIGFGAGLPMKFSTNATVQQLVDTDVTPVDAADAVGFTADLDIIGGNSGGPIINVATGQIEGVVSSDLGTEDIIFRGDCARFTVCPDDPECTEGFTNLASVTNPRFAAVLQQVGATGDGQDGGNGGSDGGGNGGGDGGNEPDADGDGVPDADDLCPGTPAGETVDADGCEDFVDGGGLGGGICGAMGFIQFGLMLLGLTSMRRRR